MQQVFMTAANKGLVEFSITANALGLLRINYRIHTLADANAVRQEFRNVIAQTLDCVVGTDGQEKDCEYLCLVRRPDENWGTESLAG